METNVTITVTRLKQSGRIAVYKGRDVVLILSEDTAIVLATALRGVAVNQPATCIVHPETDRRGASLESGPLQFFPD